MSQITAFSRKTFIISTLILISFSAAPAPPAAAAGGLAEDGTDSAGSESEKKMPKPPQKKASLAADSPESEKKMPKPPQKKASLAADSPESKKMPKPPQKKEAKSLAAEKDEILEELKFSAQGIFTDSENISKPPQKEDLSDSDTNTQDNKTEKIQDYFAHPSRIKKEALEKQLNSIISENPKNEEAYWELFELSHHYMEWSQNTEFYQESQPFQVLKLLQDMHKQFGENQKITKYLCQYFIINHLYQESQPYCQKAKKLLPEDTDLHIYADYLNEASGQKPSAGKSQTLLNLLKTKAPTEKLYTVIGQMFADKKKYKLSVKYFQKAVKMNDSYILGLLGLAEVLTKSGQHEAALKYYILACQKHPYKVRTPFQQAKAYLSQNSLFKPAGEYQKQINICVNSIKTSH